jgi:ubiquinol-cytochrome c reductase iron-sulfur subunit
MKHDGGECCHAANTLDDPSKRDFLYTTTVAFGAVGALGVAIPLVNQMNPDRSVLAMSTTEVDISNLQPGQTITTKWRGKPVFVKRRTLEELAELKATPLSDLIDPETDEDRTKEGHEELLVVLGNCTHLGCVPVKEQGDYKGGWYCPCHGSHYDAAGRIRRGPAPKNLVVPEYKFLSDTKILIG